MLFFVHIPKAAGTSLRAALQTALGERLVPVYAGRADWSPDAVAARRLPTDAVLFGHFSWGLHERIGAEPRYAAVFRHPVDRLVSWYTWIGKHPHLRLHRDVQAGVPLADMIKRRVSRDLSNAMTAQIAGRKPRSLHDPETLEIAKRNLAAFEFVSTVDRLPQHLSSLERLIGAKLGKVPRLNVSGHFELDAATRQAILDANPLDTALFEFAQSLGPAAGMRRLWARIIRRL